MSRFICLAVALSALSALPGCSSCFGGGNCRRPSFMEFRSPCGGRSEPCPPPMAPACEPCGPACPPAPCCEGGSIPMGPAMPSSAPAGPQGTFS